ncbi:MAG: hypothetical protein JWQ98_983 [Chlorobi bacterium]|nr:hypothetical protein [Chlorobiota bacterium]
MTAYRAIIVAFSLAALSVASGNSLRAQGGGGEDSPIEFRTEFPRVGGELGFASVWQSGTYDAGCGHFEKGFRINPFVAGAYDMPFPPFNRPGFRFEALLGFQGRSVKSSYNSLEQVVLVAEDSSHARVDVNFENVGTADFTYVFFLPSMKYYITKGFYAGAGLNLGLLLSSTTQYTKNISSKTVDVKPLGLSEIYYPAGESSDPYSKVFDKESRTDASSLGVDIAAYVGAEFALGHGWKLGPRILYTIPMTTVFKSPDLKLNTLEFLVGARYDLR